MSDNPDPSVISIEHLKVYYPVRKGVFGAVTGTIRAVDDISISINRGEIFALVGESGCGKTTTAQAVLGLQEPTSGTITLAVGPWRRNPAQWNQLSTVEKRRMRKHLQVIFQDPYSSLNPRMSVASILEEPLIIHKTHDKKGRRDRIIHILEKVGLSSEYLSRFPHEFSGGQRQRIGIARALITEPETVIADEPVSALDVSIQAQIINLLQDLQTDYRFTMMFISHDLSVVRHIANRLGVMYKGRLVELGTDSQIFSNALHPYTQLLLESVPVPGKGRALRNVQELPETSQVIPHGCLFYPRCRQRTTNCLDQEPSLRDTGDGHIVACCECKS
jgi:peptide/nickel transport system ATP-binding protein/oligopeptide transport system ATP-binding protein